MQTKSDTISPLFSRVIGIKGRQANPLLSRGEELLRQIGDQATLLPQRRLHWISRAMAREFGSLHKTTKATGIHWN